MGLFASLVLPATGAEAAPSQWTYTNSPKLGGSQLADVSCTSSGRCMAVGSFKYQQNVLHTLIDSWNGTNWSVTPSPNPGSHNNGLTGVSCTSRSFCVTVGGYYTGRAYRTLVESWNGKVWSVTPSPGPATNGRYNSLSDVSCAGPTFCVAVGIYNNGSGLQSFIESWDGTAWSITPSPTIGGSLNGVTCSSPDSCIAVGYQGGYPTVAQTLVEGWDGSAWSIIDSANQGSGDDVFSRVSCTTATNCVAVGYYVDGSGSLSLVEAWDGATWSVTSSPNPGSGNNVFDGVSCVSTTSCVAVGSFDDANEVPTVTQNLIESWDGTTWSVTPSPDKGTRDNMLDGVSCTGTTSCVAAGGFASTL